MITSTEPTAIIASQPQAAALHRERSPTPPSGTSGLLRLKLAGPMEATTATGENVLPLGRKTRALLAILALSARPIARTRLAELLWSQRTEEQGRSLLRQELHRLAEVLHPVHETLLIPTRDRVAINADLLWLDVEEALKATPERPDGLMLLDGTVLEGLDGIDPTLDLWLAAERERIQDKARAVAGTVLQHCTTAQQTIAAAHQLLKLDRANEGGWRSLMLAYHALGEQRLALQAFAKCRAALAELLDAVPSPEIQRLAAAIGRGAILPRSPSVRAQSEAGRPRSSAGRVWIGVLPLRSYALTKAEAGLPLHIVQSVSAALGLFSEMSVAPADSLAQFGDRDETTLRQVFGLDLLLDGSTRRAGPEFQLDVRLLDLRAGNQVVWTRRFTQTIVGSWLPQPELAGEIAAQVDTEIQRIESKRASDSADEPASSYHLVQRAIPLIARLHREEFDRAGALLSQAIALDPAYGPASAWRAVWIAFAIGQNWAADVHAAVAEARQLAERTLVLDPDNARSLTLVGHVQAYLARQPREANALHARAVALNPNLAMAWGLAGITSTFLGAFAEATAQFKQYRRLAPDDPNAFLFDAGMALHALLRRDYATAVALGRRASELNPQLAAGLKIYLAALGHSGQLAEAAPVLARLRSIEPGFTIRSAQARAPLVRAEDLDCYATGLFLAGAQ